MQREKEGFFHLKSPKTDRALCFGGGWHHIYVHRVQLQLSEFLEIICLYLPRDARHPAPIRKLRRKTLPCVLHVRAVLSEEVPLAYPNN
jgi:hypothetical protein